MLGSGREAESDKLEYKVGMRVAKLERSVVGGIPAGLGLTRKHAPIHVRRDIGLFWLISAGAYTREGFTRGIAEDGPSGACSPLRTLYQYRSSQLSPFLWQLPSRLASHRRYSTSRQPPGPEMYVSDDTQAPRSMHLISRT